MFLPENQWKFGTFSILTLKQILWKMKTFLNNWSSAFYLKVLRLKTHYFHSKLLSQKPMLRQIESWVQNGPFTKKGVLPAAALFFWKLCFSLRRVDLMYQQPKCLFILFASAGYFFPASILNYSNTLKMFVVNTC